MLQAQMLVTDLCLAEFAIGVLLQSQEFLMLLLCFFQLVLQVCVLTGALLQLKMKSTFILHLPWWVKIVLRLVYTAAVASGYRVFKWIGHKQIQFLCWS